MATNFFSERWSNGRAPTRSTKWRAPLFVLFALCVATLAVFPSHALAQAKKPITRDGLVKAVRINGLSTAELIQQIQTRGVSFEMTPDAESELRTAGARPEVIDAARSNYRPEVVPASNTASKGRTNVPPGPPLSKSEVVTMLQAGTPSARVEQFVEVRGVSFQSNAQTAQEIKRAGGTNSLVGAITSSYVATGKTRTQPVVVSNRPAPVRAPDYDELTDQATAAYDAKDAARATRLLSQAIGMEPNQPRAYQLLGFTQLYLQGNITEAEKNMRKAIELGGSAAFRVFHDHANGSFNSTCSGTLFVTKTNITYKADDGRDTFETDDAGVREIKVNNLAGGTFGALLGGRDLGAFHIKVKRASDSKNYNFAPLTKKKAESELIINLVKGFGGVQG